jgi:hypothetical protein
MIVVKIPSDGTSRISVYENDNLFCYINRKKYLFTGLSEFYINQEKIAIVKSLLFSIKIKFQNFEFKISKNRDFPFYINFSVNNNKIIIIDNPFFLILPWYSSMIYWNNNLVAIVKLKKVLDIEGITFLIDFKTDNEEVKYYTTITYLMTCLHTNI